MKKHKSLKLEIFGFAISRKRHRTCTCGNKEFSTEFGCPWPYA